MNIPEWLNTFSQDLIMVQITPNHQLMFMTTTCTYKKMLINQTTLGMKSSGTWINQHKTKKFC